jgi:membrane protease YdiL (CAAX protease family)
VAAAYLPQPFAALPQVVVFGVGHLYQGPRGVVLTGIVGAFFTLIVFVTGSLPMAMAVHALMDLHAGDLAWRTYAHDGDDDLAPAA